MLTSLKSLVLAASIFLPLAVCAQSTRFDVTGNSVYDSQTDLSWSRCNMGQKWEEGRNWCVGIAKRQNIVDAREYVKNLGGGWRISTLEELKSITDVACLPLQSQMAMGGIIFADMQLASLSWYLTETMNGDSHVMAFACNPRMDGGLGMKFNGSFRLVKTGR